MSACRERPWVQDYLDGALVPERADAFRGHLQGCATCRAEVEAFGVVFAALRGAQVANPGSRLTERILDRVLPSRLRRRWVRGLAWSYGTAAAASTVLLVWWVARADTQVWLAKQYGTASLRVVQAVLFTLQTLTRSWLEVMDGWGLLARMGERTLAVGRALAAPLSDPLVTAILSAALAACAALLWWMRRRPTAEEGRHVGLLAL